MAEVAACMHSAQSWMVLKGRTYCYDCQSIIVQSAATGLWYPVKITRPHAVESDHVPSIDPIIRTTPEPTKRDRMRDALRSVIADAMQYNLCGHWSAEEDEELDSKTEKALTTIEGIYPAQGDSK